MYLCVTCACAYLGREKNVMREKERERLIDVMVLVFSKGVCVEKGNERKNGSITLFTEMIKYFEGIKLMVVIHK